MAFFENYLACVHVENHVEKGCNKYFTSFFQQGFKQIEYNDWDFKESMVRYVRANPQFLRNGSQILMSGDWWVWK